MIYTNNLIIKKALLEFGRIILIAVIPVTIASLESGVLDLRAIAISGLIAGLKAVDKLLHELGLEIEEETDEKSGFTKGITRF